MMEKLAQFVLLGLGTGGAFALLGLGAVLIYRGSGIVNFAQGAFAAVGAIVYYELHGHLPVVAVVAVSVLVTTTLGALTQMLVMRPLSAASPIARVVATLAILAVVEQYGIQRWGEGSPFVTGFLPERSIGLWGSVSISLDRVLIVSGTCLLAAGLWWVYRSTRFGLATTAVAHSEQTTAALGWSPQWLCVGNWALGGGLAGLAGVLLAPITGLNVNVLTLSVVPALAAALLGGFESFPLVLVGGLLIGVLESVTTGYVTAPGWPEVVPFAILLVVLVVRGRPLPLRSHLADRLPRIGSGRVRPFWVCIGFAVAASSVMLFTASWTQAMLATATLGLVCLSLVIVTGYCGQLSLAQFALAGVGALIAARSSQVWGLPFALAVLLGAFATIPVAVVVALPAIRARGVSLAVATLGLATIITDLVLANPDYTGGLLTGTVVRPPSLLGWSVDPTRFPVRYTVLVWFLFIVAAVGVANLRRGRVGRRLIAVRGNERAAASLGLSVVACKLYAFAVGGFLAALGGALMAFRHPHVDFNQFSTISSVTIVMTSVIGGVGYATGAVIGGMSSSGGVAEELMNHAFSITSWFIIISTAVLLIVLMIQPDGAAHRMTADLLKLRAKAGFPARSRASHRRTSAPLDAERVRSRVPSKSLEVRDLTVRFGGVVALEGVDLEVRPGEVVGLIGPNGAGKTTLIDAVTGFVPYSGHVFMNGQTMNRITPFKRARLGLTRSFQSLELFEDLTVLDNIRVATDPRDKLSWFSAAVRAGDDPLTDSGTLAAKDFRLLEILDELPEDLSYAQRRLVGIARTVAAKPSILLLDEPAAGLDDWSTAELGHLIRSLADDWGMGVLLVEHDVKMVLETCDRVVVLQYGKTIASGSPAEVRSDSAVIEAYLGTDDSDPATSEACTVGAPIVMESK